MNFPYYYEKRSLDTLEIDDIGNVSLNVYDDDGDEFYLSIKTKLGWTEIQTFGPLIAGEDIIPSSFNYYYCKHEYNEKKLTNTIDSFLNKRKTLITQAFIIDGDEVELRLKNLKKQL